MSVRDDPKGVFRALIESYGDLSRRLNHGLTRSIDAQDVLQDTWLKLARTAVLPDVANPKAYVSHVAGNLAIDHLRAQRVRERYFQVIEFEEVPVNAPSAERVVDYKQRMARLEEIIERLPPRQREAFLLHKFDGLSHSEIADRMRITRSAVEKLLMKALASCRDGLGDLLDNN